MFDAHTSLQIARGPFCVIDLVVLFISTNLNSKVLGSNVVAIPVMSFVVYALLTYSQHWRGAKLKKPNEFSIRHIYASEMLTHLYRFFVQYPDMPPAMVSDPLPSLWFTSNLPVCFVPGLGRRPGGVLQAAKGFGRCRYGCIALVV
jgi:hypothetical protein